jgi:hypothetical protein
VMGRHNFIIGGDIICTACKTYVLRNVVFFIAKLIFISLRSTEWDLKINFLRFNVMLRVSANDRQGKFGQNFNVRTNRKHQRNQDRCKKIQKCV